MQHLSKLDYRDFLDQLIPKSKETDKTRLFKDDYMLDFLGLTDDFSERDLRRAVVSNLNENPSVGLILCKDKDDETVRISVSKVTTPMKVATYKTKLIDRKLLKKKLHSLPVLEEKE